MRIVVACTYVPFQEDGADRVADDLGRELTARGFQTDVVRLPFAPTRESFVEQTLGLRLLDLSEACGERIDRLVAVGAPCYALRHPVKSAWFLPPADDGPPDESVRCSDTLYLRECKKVFTLTRQAADRVKRRHAIDVGVLYSPPRGALQPGPLGDYLFQPGPIRPARRQALAIEAMKYMRPEVRLVIGGATGSDSCGTELRGKVRREGLAGRVEFTGLLSEEREAALASGCRAVLDLACGEDAAGRATLTAFQAARPAVTLTDCAAGAELIEHEVNGLVAAPEPRALAAAVGRLFADPESARRMGEAARGTPGRRRIDWDHVIENLLS